MPRLLAMSSNEYHLCELPYSFDSVLLFSKIVEWPWAILLDSCQPHGEQGRYDIMSARPYKTLSTIATVTIISTKGKGQEISTADPLQLLKEQIQAMPFQAIEPLPFSGGALGYFSYDLAARIAGLPVHKERLTRMPDMAIGLYDWGIIVDHLEKRSWCFAQNTWSHAEWYGLLQELHADAKADDKPAALRLLTPLQSNMDREAYDKAFANVQYHIYEGDCYQVNLAQCFSAPVEGNSWQTYCALRKANPAPYSGFMHIPQGSILSLSPEQFLQVRAGFVQTKPIKGTRPRNQDPEIDARLAAELLASEKDRAENVMIVDLLRNDLGKSCRAGSIRVPQLFSLESFTSVHHLVSTITGELSSGQHGIDLLRDCFPGGSITGAPKKRSMGIIASLEPHNRSLYCGAMGYIDHSGNMETNIAIRSLIVCDNRVYCYAGGGLVADSTAENEYQETFTKVSKIMQVLHSRSS